ncbi:MAG: CTP synthase [Moraxellaceae bacterium]|nr:CTP synthase [Pseudobdellovibrionaceae bacterium]
MSSKYIFITGGVVSSIGKGLTAASLGSLLEARGFTVSIMKFDPYLNVDPGTMSPLQHGEVFVTEDGAETDLDLGHYERFTKALMKRSNSVSAGQIYDRVISRERRGDYLGGTVQVIPHITDEIKSRVFEVSHQIKNQITLVEIGGTVGDIEAQPFFEAIRQLRLELGPTNTALVHVTYVPYIAVAGELKSKPTQHSVKELREIGLQPDFLICRSEKTIDDALKAKIGLFCSVKKDHVISAKDSSSIYEVPLALSDENFDALIIQHLKLKSKKPDLSGWKKIVNIQKHPHQLVNIAIVGKYVDLKESYKSLHESLVHAGIANKAKLVIKYIDSEKVTKQNVKSLLKEMQAVLVPGGFGTRGVEGKILAIQHARENKIPFLGICFGMQLSAIEFARNVCHLKQATSREFIQSLSTAQQSKMDVIIDSMVEQREVTDKGGTMRLGAFKCKIQPKSLALKIYKKNLISERHRHRFEFNNKYKTTLEKAGLVFSGMNPDRNLVEIIENPNHPWFVGVQFHPEFKSQPLNPHPLFVSFVKASIKL